MPEPRPVPARRSLLGDLGIVWSRRKQVWRLLRRNDKLGFFSAVIVTAFVAYIQVQIAVLIGVFFNRVLKMTGQPGAQTDFVEKALALLAGLYVLKESLQLLRRWLVTRTGSRIEGDMTVRLVGHLLRIDLGALAAERIGSLHGRISRSVEGFVKFLKVVFADFVPAVATASYALYVGLKTDWRVGLVMLAVVPVSILITVWQVNSQKGVRTDLLRAKEGLDGTVVEQLGGLEYNPGREYLSARSGTDQKRRRIASGA
ncbi:MAG: ATP-binding cassette, subfamily bacterial [Verrucomicrobiota bacterium]